MAKKERTPSRAQLRERALGAARAQELAGAYDVCVVGGGASGLVAGIVAAEAGSRVVVVDRDLEAGRTILATGNGRCNFCNVSLAPKRYRQPGFVAATCGERWLDDVLGFFRESGLRWALEDDRLYPVSRQAASVRNVLLGRARRGGVCVASCREVGGLEREADGWRVSLRGIWDDADDEVLDARAIVLASGGGTARDLASDLGLRCVAERPVLAPLSCEPSPLQALDGRRAHVIASLYPESFPMLRVRGEVLLRDYGLSGIVTFDLSRQAQAGDVVSLDLLPDLNVSELRQIVDPWAHGSFEDDAFDGLLDPAIAALLVRLARERWELPGDERAGITHGSEAASDTEAMLSLVKGLPFRVTGVAQPEQAQVTQGGLDVRQFDPETLGVSGCTGLFACGELLDVDADCGGFNLAWAWKSGMVAGQAAAEAARAASGGEAGRHHA